MLLLILNFVEKLVEAAWLRKVSESAGRISYSIQRELVEASGRRRVCESHSRSPEWGCLGRGSRAKGS